MINKGSSDDDACGFFGKKMGHVVANCAGCPGQGWRSGIKIVWGFGEC